MAIENIINQTDKYTLSDLKADIATIINEAKEMDMYFIYNDLVILDETLWANEDIADIIRVISLDEDIKISNRYRIKDYKFVVNDKYKVDGNTITIVDVDIWQD